jgi:predicted transglutaminase-like cysteine proteinase
MRLFSFPRQSTVGLHQIVTVSLAVSSLALLSACASTPTMATKMPTGQVMTQPLGAMMFCTSHPDECSSDDATSTRVALTDQAMQELRDVQYRVDEAIDPTGPVALAWDYAVDGRGSCVQYALEKRRDLIERGWPVSALRLATAITHGVGHLILIANTTAGDYALDNMQRDVTPWQELPYEWGEIQQGASLRHWVLADAAGGHDEVGNVAIASLPANEAASPASGTASPANELASLPNQVALPAN